LPRVKHREVRSTPLQNRVTPLSELVADPARGLVYGNRGCLHDDRRRIRRRYAGKRWIACRLSFRGRRRHPLMQLGRFTELFFLDEATAFAAGHRPCALCRREDYRRFLEVLGESSADALDARLHGERVDTATHAQRRHTAPFAALPDGTFVLHGGEPDLVLGDALLRWTPAGYTRRQERPREGLAVVLTPPSLVSVLRAGWAGAVPLLHPSSTTAAANGTRHGVLPDSPP
jgi:hypothetical protein